MGEGYLGGFFLLKYAHLRRPAMARPAEHAFFSSPRSTPRSLRAVTSLCMSTTAWKWSFAGRLRGPVTEINFLMKIRIRSGKRCPVLFAIYWGFCEPLTVLLYVSRSFFVVFNAVKEARLKNDKHFLFGTIGKIFSFINNILNCYLLKYLKK